MFVVIYLFLLYFLQDAESDVEEHEKQLQELKNVAALYADEVTLGRPHKYNHTGISATTPYVLFTSFC